MAAKAKKTEPKIPAPSSEVVDAYKTYLSKAMPTLTAKDFAEGAPIPTDQVEKDILILENKIAQYKKFGFPCDKEEDQLEILKKYKAGVQGKNWPTAKKAMNAAANMAADQLKYVGCQHPSNSRLQFTTATGVEMLKCQVCGKVWHAPLGPVKIGTDLGIWYDQTFLKNLKAQTPNIKKNPILLIPPSFVTENVKPLAMRVGKTEVEQRFLMQMGMLSNCNVSIARIASSYMDKFVLKCAKCDQTVELSDALLIAKVDGLPVKVEEFCIAHRHDAKAFGKEQGRYFREDDDE